MLGRIHYSLVGHMPPLRFYYRTLLLFWKKKFVHFQTVETFCYPNICFFFKLVVCSSLWGNTNNLFQSLCEEPRHVRSTSLDHYISVESIDDTIWNFIKNFIDPPLEGEDDADEDSFPVLAYFRKKT
jgi:hypothetical protein